MSGAQPAYHAQFRANRLLWAALAVVATTAIFWMQTVGIRPISNETQQFATIFGICIAAALSYGRMHHDQRLFFFTNAIAQMIVAGFSVSALSALTAMWNRPFIDTPLIAFDTAIGFDWLAYVHAVAANYWLMFTLTASYQSFGLQIILLLCIVFAKRHSAHGQRFAIAFLVSGLLTTLGAGLWPAEGAWVRYDSSDIFPEMARAVAGSNASLLHKLREHSIHELYFPMEGLIWFPSFHSACAVLLLYLSLALPWGRWFFVPLNIAMLFATPVLGGHYLADTLAGIAVALIGIACAKRLLPSAPINVAGT